MGWLLILTVLYVLTGAVIGSRYSSLAMIAVTPLTIAVAFLLGRWGVIGFGLTSLILLVTGLEAGFLLGAFRSSRAKDRAG